MITHQTDNVTLDEFPRFVAMCDPDMIASCPDWGDGAALVGKRVVRWDERGFHELFRFPTVAAAEQAFNWLETHYSGRDAESENHYVSDADNSLYVEYIGGRVYGPYPLAEREERMERDGWFPDLFSADGSMVWIGDHETHMVCEVPDCGDFGRPHPPTDSPFSWDRDMRQSGRWADPLHEFDRLAYAEGVRQS